MMSGLSLRAKLFLSFFLIAAISASFLVFSRGSLHRVQRLSAEMIPTSRQIGILQRSHEAYYKIESMVEGYLLVGSDRHRDRIFTALAAVKEDLGEVVQEMDLPLGIAILQMLDQFERHVVELIETKNKPEGSYQANKAIINLAQTLEDLKTRQLSLIEAVREQQEGKIIEQGQILDSILFRFFLVEFLIIMASILCAVLLSRFILKELSILRGFTSKIARGNLAGSVAVKSRDEIGQLADSFNEMTWRLKQSRESLEAEIAERMKAQADLARHRDDLEDKVSERTEELRLANENLSRRMEERKQAEKELRRSRAFLEKLMDSIPIPVFHKDTAGIYRGCNTAFSEFLGLNKEDIIGKTVDDLFQGDLADTYREADQRLFQDPGTMFYEGKLDHTDGSRREVLFNKATFVDEEGNIAGLIGAALDISERVRAEAHRADLEAQLRQAYKMEAIGTLAGGIAHDFNNVLGIVIGNLELAADDIGENDSVRLSLSEARKACLRAKEMVKRILAFSRKEDSQLKPIDLKSIVKEDMTMLRGSIPTTIEIQLELEAGHAMILGNPTQLHQVLVNLCTNAFQAMEETGGVLKVCLVDVDLDADAVKELPELTAGKHVRLSVSDSGHGMAPDLVEKIFDPYFTTKAVDKGSGMGLAVVHGIVKHHRGVITVESAPGEGTTFHVFLPNFEGEHEEREIERDEDVRGGDERILLVDDESALVKAGHRMLESLGYSVEPTTDPVEALNVFRRQPDEFDLIISDVTMPKMTGERLAREVMDVRPDVPVVLCTGYSHLLDKAAATDMGVKGFVMKPLVKRELAGVVRSVLDG